MFSQQYNREGGASDYCGNGAESCGAGQIGFWLVWRPGRKILSFCILQIRVVRFKPSLAAAPLGPPITQPTASSVCRIRARSESLRVVAAGGVVASLDTVVGRGLGKTPKLERITARSIRFCNSRMLPGHQCELSADIVSGGMSLICLPIRRQKMSTKCVTRIGISS